MNLLIWAVVAYGMTNILVYGSIFNDLRNKIHRWGDSKGLLSGLGSFLSGLISCVLCTSTWVGFFFSLTLFSPWHEMIGLNQYISIFFDGMLSAGAVWALNGIIEGVGENRPNNN